VGRQSLSQTSLLHGLEHKRTDLGGRVRHNGTGIRERLDLVLRTALATRDDGSTVSMRREMKKRKRKRKIKNTTTTIPTKGRTKKI
jgi:hypothetical protein